MKNNRIQTLFQTKKKNILSIFFTAGFPQLANTSAILKELQNSGADMVEIGIPFSDPIADGPVIQQSNQLALENGMTLNLLFDQLKDIRKEIKMPILLMGYFNPVFQMGLEVFLKKCTDIGIDGVILPDLPAEIYEEQYKALFEQANVANVFLITPKTSPERITYLDSLSRGFIYLVSSSGTTGKDAQFHEKEYLRIRSMNLKNPLMIGFGISDNASFQKACASADGAIVGSAFIKALQKENPIAQISPFVNSLLKNQTVPG